MNVKKITLLLVAFFLFIPSISFGGGFLIYNQDAAATGQGLAFTAQADNPSAVFYNPAAINRLEGTQISSGSTLLMPQTSFKSAMTGSKTDMNSHIYLLPNIFVTHKINDKFSAGIGFYSLFGLSVDWPDDWEGKYLSTFSALRSFYLNPVISWQVIPEFSLALGGSLIYSDVEQRKALSFAPLPVHDGKVKLDADGISGGYNVALLYHANNHVDVGISYRSKVSLTYKGDVKTKAPSHLASFIPHGDVSLDIDFPPILVMGVATSYIDNLTIEADLYWIGWSTYDELYADFEKSVPKAFAKFTAPIPRNYHDVLTYSVGMKYRLNPHFVLRAGYMYDTSPVPEKTCDPILPDSDRNEISIGIGYNNNNYSLDLAYYAVIAKDRKVTNNINGFDGKYEFFCNEIALNFNYKF